MAVGDVWRLAVIGSNQGIDELVNVHHYLQTTVGGDDFGVDLIDAWHASCGLEYVTVFSDLCLLVGYQVRNLTQPEFGTDYSLPTAINGERTGQMLPPSIAPVVSWRTGLIGRRRRGRTYTWPGSEDDQNAGQMSLTWQGLLSAWAATALNISGDANYNKVIFSSDEDYDPPTLVTPVQGFVIDALLGSQRRRRPGVGS